MTVGSRRRKRMTATTRSRLLRTTRSKPLQPRRHGGLFGALLVARSKELAAERGTGSTPRSSTSAAVTSSSSLSSAATSAATSPAWSGESGSSRNAATLRASFHGGQDWTSDVLGVVPESRLANRQGPRGATLRASGAKTLLHVAPSTARSTRLSQPTGMSTLTCWVSSSANGRAASATSSAVSCTCTWVRGTPSSSRTL